jgi:hypothetical protein
MNQLGRTTLKDISPAALLPGPAAEQWIFDRSGARMALWAVVSVIFTSVILQYSLVHDRLLLPASHDEVTYVLDGLNRLQIWYGQGLGALLLNFLAHPPHAPFSALIAIAGFALFGMHDWAPYAMNAVIVFTLLAFLDAVLGTVWMRWKIAVATVALCTPIAGQSIAQFQPDIFAGLLTAIVVVVLLDGPIIVRRPGQLLNAGVVWGCSLLVNPSAFPMTLGLGGLALVLGTVRDIWFRPPWRIKIVDIAAAWFLVLLPALVLPLPYYLAAGQNIFQSTLTNEAGSQRFIPAAGQAHLLYYSIGPGGAAMLGPFFWIFLGVIAIGTALLAWGSDRRTWATIACGGFVGIAAYAGPTLFSQQQTYLAAPFGFLLLFGSILILRQVMREHLPPVVGLVGVAMAIITVAASLYCSAFPASASDRADVRGTRRAIDDVYGAIRDHTNAEQAKVWLPLTGPMSADLLRYMAAKDGLSLAIAGDANAADLNGYRKEYAQGDFVVRPVNPMLDTTLSLIRSRHDLELLATIPAGPGENYYVFQERGRSRVAKPSDNAGPLPQVPPMPDR